VHRFLAQGLLGLADAELARHLGQAGCRRVQREFRVEKMVQSHAELYRELLA
jgi:hypothetical protein